MFNKQRLKSLFLVFFITSVIIFFNCSSSTEPESDGREPSTATITFKFRHHVDEAPLFFDSLMYTTGDGKKYQITTLKYYLSDFVFQNKKGEELLNLDTILYMDHDDTSTLTHTVPNAPLGGYASLSFTFGIASDKNISNSLPNTTDNINMAWPEIWGGGYHFMKFEGKYQDTSIYLQGFTIHIGTNKYGGFHQVNSFTIAPQTFTQNLDDKQNLHLDIAMNLNNWFTNPETYDLDTYNLAIMDNADAQDILRKNGLKDVFLLEDTEVQPLNQNTLKF